MISAIWRWMRNQPPPDDAKGSNPETPAPGPRAARGRETAGRLGVIELHTERSRDRWGRRALRTTLVAALVLLMVLGMRALLRPYPKPQPVVLPASLSYDRGGASATAARWAGAYLSLPMAGDTAAVEARATALAQDAGSNVETTTALNVTTEQRVETILPSTVEVNPDGRGSIVTVLARVVTGKTPPRWVALAVPVGTDGRRPVVVGTAAFVAVPPPGAAERAAGATPSQDSPLTTQTRNRAAAWFAAYGAGNADALNGISAPGAQIAPIGGLGVKSLDAWQVNAGGADTRTAAAVVTWTTPSGAIQQSYQLTLSAVRSGSTTDWRVLTVTASTQR